jgi:hypothetical protein
MTGPKGDSVDKAEIVKQIADLSRLLGMIPGDDTVPVTEPVTKNTMPLSEWFAEARDSLLRLSTQLDKALDLNLQ